MRVMRTWNDRIDKCSVKLYVEVQVQKKKTKVLRLVYYNNLALYIYLYIKIGTYTHIDNDCTRVYRRKYGIVVKLL